MEGWIGPLRSAATRQLHAGTLKGRLRRTASDRRGLSCGIGKGLEGRPTYLTHGDRHSLTMTDVNPGGLGWEPLGDDSAHNPLEQAAFLTAENGFKLPTLVCARIRIDVETRFAISAKEIARPFRRKDHLHPPDVDAVNLPLFDIVQDGAATPPLVGGGVRAQPAGTQHLTATELDHASRHIPRHTLSPSG
jgi:hypothetical protein